jgi:hypothetical protein
MRDKNRPYMYMPPQRACTCSDAHGDSNAHLRRRAPSDPGFREIIKPGIFAKKQSLAFSWKNKVSYFRKNKASHFREKHLGFHAGL